MDKTTLKQLQDLVVKFRDERDWKQFHHPKDLAIALSIEMSEVLEHFRFKNNEEILEYLKKENNKKELSHEIADVFILFLALADVTEIDVVKALHEKTKINEKRYPIEKCKGKPHKYSKYEN
ncbi:nucleotide pyrophosphohydrolase [Candidatus Woesearchaeota archaeon]|jgi:dCTP diphosphatase|nr:nucleotide pyrophosphohydrolase [Candidatus Woesearchaeota archaeon]